MVVVAPSPSASVRTATVVKPGLFLGRRRERTSRCCSLVCCGPPKRRSAWRRASAGGRPRWRFSSMANCRCEEISASRSRSSSERRKKERMRCRSWRSQAVILLPSSFVTQGDHWVDAHGAASGDVTGEQGNECDDEGDGAEGEWIGWADAIKFTREDAHEGKGRSKSQGDAQERSVAAFFEDGP